MKNFTLFLFLVTGGFLAFSQPANDRCANATLITNLDNWCSANGAGTSVGSTDDVATGGGYSVASCWGGTVNDVWFRFVAIATDVTIVINGNQGSPVGGTLNRPQVALYSGTCGGTINELACGSPPAGRNIIQIYKGGLTIGETYYIRVDGFNTNTGTFQYCINNYNPVPNPTSDCNTAVVLCDKSSFSVPAVSGAGANATEMNAAPCFEYSIFTGNVETNSAWYVFTFKTGGTFTFVLNPSNPGDDLDFVVYRLPTGIGSCGSKILERCEASQCPSIGWTTGLNTTATDVSEYGGCAAGQDNFLRQLTVTAGQTYALGINNFTSTGNGFSISFGGTAEIQGPEAFINDSDADDIICINEAITFTDASIPPPSGTITQWTWNFGVGATPATFNGQIPPPVTYSSNGTKTISLTIRSNQGCLVTETKNINVTTQAPAVNLAVSQNGICPSTSVTFTATPTNGGTSPTYQWYVNNVPLATPTGPTFTTSTLNNNDQVKVQITSNSSCASPTTAMSNIITMSVVAPSPVGVTITGNTPVCQGSPLTLTANPTNGGASPTYQWFLNGNPVGTNSNTYTSSSFNNSDVVTVRLTSSLSCVTGNPATSAPATITVTPRPTVTVNSPTICSGTTAALTASGATSYTWTGGLGSGASVTTPILTSNQTYTVTGTASGCTNTAVATITVTPRPTVTVNSPTICSGTTAALTASGATSYTWTGGLGSGASVTTPTLTSNQTYTVTGTANGCTNTAVANVTVTPRPTVTVNSPTICSGTTAALTASGATSYTWTGGLGSGASVTTPILTSNQTYTVTGTTSGCTNTAVATVTVTPLPTVTVNSPTICSGTTAALTASGATSYTWTGGLGSGASVTTPTLTSNQTYTVTGTASGCTNTAVATVTVTPRPTVTVNSPTICSGTTAALTASGATSYTWTGGLGSGASVTTPTLTSNQTYTVTGTASGCTNTAVANVTVTPLPIVTVNSPTICSGTTTALTASGATTYTWTGGLGSGASVTTPILTSNQTYTVTGTTSGCTNTAVATVTVTPLPTVTVNSPTICSGTTAVLTASGATTYTWSGGLVSGASVTTPILTSNQTYTVTGTTSGCTNTAVATVTVTPRPTVTVNSPTICSGTTAALTASGASSYTWTGGLGSVASVTTPILTSNQSYTVTGTASGCTNTAVANVTVTPLPTLIVNNPIICSGRTATLTVSGATTYSWSGGLGSGASVTTPTLTSNQSYTVTGTASGCTNSAVVNVTVNPNPVVNVNSPTICSGTTAALTANGATTYTWSGGLGSGASVTTPILTSNQNFTVTGTTNGCTGTAIASVTLKPTKTTAITRTICSDENVVIGSQSFNQTGNYSVTLQTSQNCDSIVNLNLTVIDVLVPAVTITASKTDICPGNSVTFNATAVNTGLPPTYQWYVNDIPVGTNSAQYSSSTLNNGDKVKVGISTTSSCAVPNSATSNEITITKNSITYTKPIVAYCKLDSQLIDLGITTIPNSPVTVKWTNGGVVSTQPNGIYTVRNTANASIPFEITYGNNCKVNDVLNATVFSLPVIDAVTDIADAKYEQTIQLNVLTNAQLSYNWLPSSQVSNDTIRNPSSIITSTTLFTVNVRDNNNCRSSDTVLVRLIDECKEEFIYVPSAFSPNGDGINDCFSIISPPKLSDFSMLIFNRWGEKVFEAKDEFTCWDGTFKGTPAQSDAHIYVISFTCYNGKKLMKKGTVTIMR